VKTLHTYLARQILASLLMTVAVFTVVLLLGSALKEILPVLISGQVKFGVVARAIGLLVPFVAVFALPMGTLAATLLIFGRFSADQELTAARASGISLLSLVSPILLLSLLLCGVSALVNMEVGPRCRVLYTTMLNNLRMEFSTAYLPEGRPVKDFPGYIFYIGRNNKSALPDVRDLEDVIIFDLKDQSTVRAPRGKLEVDKPKQRLNLHLYDGRVISLSAGRTSISGFEEMTVELDVSQPQQGPQKPRVDDMTFGQLRAELRDLERLMAMPMPLQNLTREQLAARKLEWAQKRKDLITPVMFQIHRQVAFSFACFGFTLVGIPLGIRVHRRETNIGIAIALLLVALYYSFIIVGQVLNTRPECAPYLFVWLPNLLFQAVGAVLLWRANRGG
jgi:lipopolysaccharide export system permease protein